MIGLIGLLAFNTIKVETLQIKQEGVQVSFVFEDKNVDGTFSDFSGNIQFDPDNLAQSSISGSVPVETIVTGIGFRNWHLKREKYFNEEQYPRIKYESKQISRTEDGYKMTGNMTIKGTTKPVDFTFTYQDKVFKGNAILYSSDFGVSINKDREDNKVSIQVEVPVM